MPMDLLPGAGADLRSEVEGALLTPEGELARTDPGKLVPHNPPAAKHAKTCLRPRMARSRVASQPIMYRARALIFSSGHSRVAPSEHA